MVTWATFETFFYSQCWRIHFCHLLEIHRVRNLHQISSALQPRGTVQEELCLLLAVWCELSHWCVPAGEESWAQCGTPAEPAVPSCPGCHWGHALLAAGQQPCQAIRLLLRPAPRQGLGVFWGLGGFLVFFSSPKLSIMLSAAPWRTWIKHSNLYVLG